MSIDKISNDFNSAREYKKGSKVGIVNNRPISVLCMLSENDRTENSRNNILYDLHSGFRLPLRHVCYMTDRIRRMVYCSKLCRLCEILEGF